MLPSERLRRAWKPATAALDDLPLVLVGKHENSQRIFATDGAAAKLGLHPGLALSDARARVPSLRVAEADEAMDRAFLGRIADWCDRFTPLVATDPPAGIFLDITGCAHLFGGERAMGEKIARELRAQNLTVRYAIAGTAAAARVLARHASGLVVDAGGEASAVSPLSVSFLQVESEIVAALMRAGLKTIGEVALRRRQELAARFGAHFLFYLDQVLGNADAPISPRRHPPEYSVERNYAEPVATSEAVECGLLALAGTLCEILEGHGMGVRRLEAVFFRSDGVVRRIAVETGQPLRDRKIIMRLLRERMESLADPLDPGFGFDLIRLSASRVEVFAPEEAGFGAGPEDAHEISALVDRLSARLSADRVLKFEAQDTHDPARAARLIPAQHARQAGLWQGVRESGEPPQRPLRLFEPPELLQNVIAEVPDGPPASFIWRRARHTVLRAGGPERIAAEWWRDERASSTRDYFRVENENGQRYWIYRQGLFAREAGEPAWFMHGAFA
jgi:protein ImuB